MLAQGGATEGSRPGRRVLAVDLGERRIGLAISDPDGSFALPLAVLARTSDRQVIGEIRAVAIRESIGLLVVGEPRTPEGVRGPAAERARRFAARLARACALPFLLVDETLTTVEAAARRAPRPANKTDQPGQIDAHAAAVILQEALDRGLAGGVR